MPLGDTRIQSGTMGDGFWIFIGEKSKFECKFNKGYKIIEDGENKRTGETTTSL